MSKTNKIEKSDLDGLKSDEIFQKIAGGEMIRGGVSKTIRELHSIGYTTGQIAKMLNKRYQHVRNVLTEPTKKV
jgi:hypothetical protein